MNHRSSWRRCRRLSLRRYIMLAIENHAVKALRDGHHACNISNTADSWVFTTWAIISTTWESTLRLVVIPRLLHRNKAYQYTTLHTIHNKKTKMIHRLLAAFAFAGLLSGTVGFSPVATSTARKTKTALQMDVDRTWDFCSFVTKQLLFVFYLFEEWQWMGCDSWQLFAGVFVPRVL